ncbi:MAG: glycosyltransferase [Bacteroidota bacterium]
MSGKDPLVSICCITYNHEQYIRYAIEGFLIQLTDFEYEIIIHDDASTDSTANIIRDYEEKHKELIKPIYQKVNQYSLGRKPWSEFVFPKCRGKYIALCEGDDYWTDPLKLQKQVDILEQNPTYTGIATQCKVTDGETVRVFRNYTRNTITLNDLLAGRIFHTATFMFKKVLIQNITFPIGYLSGDRLLFMVCAYFGPIYFLSDITAVYRRNEGGLSKKVDVPMMEKDISMLDWFSANFAGFPVRKLRTYILHSIISYSNKITLRDYFRYTFKMVWSAFTSLSLQNLLFVTKHLVWLPKTLYLMKKQNRIL